MPPATPPRSPLHRSKMFWIGILYFASGLPLGVFYDVFPVHFRQQGVQLHDIGFISLLGLAWTLKFLWAPAIDHYRHHRRWMFVVDLGMAGVMLLLAAHTNFGPWVWVGVGLFTLLSATNDISIDGYTIEMLSKHEMGVANGLRIGFYRVGMLAAGFILVLSDRVGWSSTYLCAAVLFVLLGFVCLRAPRERALTPRQGLTLGVELRNLIAHPWAMGAVMLFLLGAVALANRATHWSTHLPGFWAYALFAAALPVGVSALRYSRAGDAAALTRGPMFGTLLAMLQRPYIGPVILFILTFKLGDAAMGLMVKPFWVDAGFSATQIGMVSVNLGLVLSILGGLLGGWFTDRYGVFRGLWVLGLLQAFSNLGYTWTAHVLPLHPHGPMPVSHLYLMYGASGLESFAGGLGTAAFLAFLMAIVDKRSSATEYALLSSVFALSRSLAGAGSGFGAQALGYAPYFLLTFFLAFPAFLLLPWVAKMLRYAENQKGWGQEP